MTLAQFDNGYWYAAELKEFAETIGIPSNSRVDRSDRVMTQRVPADRLTSSLSMNTLNAFGASNVVVNPVNSSPRLLTP
jgi:hypothetical protein